MIKYLCIHCGAILNPQDVDCSCDNYGQNRVCQIPKNNGILAQLDAQLDVRRSLCVRRQWVTHRLTCQWQHEVRKISAHEHYVVHVVGCENSGKTSFIQHVRRWLGEPGIQGLGYSCYSENLRSSTYPVLIIRDGIVWEHVPNAIMQGIDYSTHLAIPGDVLFTVDLSNGDREQIALELAIFQNICATLGQQHIDRIKLALVITKGDILRSDGTNLDYQALNADQNGQIALGRLLVDHGRDKLITTIIEKFPARYRLFIAVCTAAESIGVEESIRWLLNNQQGAQVQNGAHVAHRHEDADEDRVPAQDG